jgi:hypothetical protein
MQLPVTIDDVEVIHRALRCLRSVEMFNEASLHATDEERTEANRTLDIIDRLLA